MTVRTRDVTVDWYGYATARLAWPSGAVAYTDPGRYGVLTGEWTPWEAEDGDGVTGEDDSAGASSTAPTHPPSVDRRPEDADVVVVTHAHHYDPDGIERVAAPDATVVVYDAVHAGDVDRDVRPVEDLPFEVVRVDDEADLLAGDVVVRSVAAHNLPDGPNVRTDGSPMHPPGFGCGFLLTADGTTAFWPGDSDVLDGHDALDVDVFLPPIGNFTMTRQDAAALAERLTPDLVVPIHYDTFPGLSGNSAAFAVDVARRGVPVALDESASGA